MASHGVTACAAEGWRTVPELFVYYRIAAANEAACRAAVKAMQIELCDVHPGLQARLLRRSDGSDAGVTFMEVYVLPAAETAIRLSTETTEAIEATARQSLAPWLQGERHVEVFLPCA